MTSSLLPWKRFDDMASFDLEESGRNFSTFRRLIYRISSIRRNINMKFDKRTVPLEDKLTGREKINMSREPSKISIRGKEIQHTTKKCSSEDENRPVNE